MTVPSSITMKEPAPDISISKKEKKINQISYVNAQISDINKDTVTIFTDGSCIRNPGPTGAGTVIFKNDLDKSAIKLAKSVSNNSTNYHGGSGGTTS